MLMFSFRIIALHVDCGEEDDGSVEAGGGEERDGDERKAVMMAMEVIMLFMSENMENIFAGGGFWRRPRRKKTGHVIAGQGTWTEYSCASSTQCHHTHTNTHSHKYTLTHTYIHTHTLSLSYLFGFNGDLF